jgi:hypothetical protein
MIVTTTTVMAAGPRPIEAITLQPRHPIGCGITVGRYASEPPSSG